MVIILLLLFLHFYPNKAFVTIIRVINSFLLYIVIFVYFLLSFINFLLCCCRLISPIIENLFCGFLGSFRNLLSSVLFTHALNRDKCFVSSQKKRIFSVNNYWKMSNEKREEMQWKSWNSNKQNYKQRWNDMKKCVKLLQKNVEIRHLNVFNFLINKSKKLKRDVN